MKIADMKPSQTCILTINGGSSSIKFAIYQVGEPLKRRLYGKIDRIGLNGTNLTFSDPTGNQQDSLSISRHRTVEQDAAFGIRQIVDVALKALSPGVIDTTTAVMCVDYLTAILARIAPRQIPSSRGYEDGELRVIAKGPSFESLLAESSDQIRTMAKGDVVIMLRMLGAIQTIAGLTADSSRRRALRGQVRWIAELAERTLESSHERARINVQLAHVREALETDGCPGEEKS